jgi:antitoxin YefM
MLARILSLDGVPPLPRPTVVQAVMQIHGVFAEHTEEAADCHLALRPPGPARPRSSTRTARGRSALEGAIRGQQAPTWSFYVAAGGWLTPVVEPPTVKFDPCRVAIQSSAAVKAHFSQLIDDVAGTHERVTVTKNGSPVAATLAVEDYEWLIETLEILSDRSAVANIREAEHQVARGQVINEEQVRAALSAGTSSRPVT